MLVSFDETPRRARVGVVLLDMPHYSPRAGVFDSSATSGLGPLPAGFFDHPRTWPGATAFAVAEGAAAWPTLQGSAEALDGLLSAVARLAPQCDVVLADCGFFWAARREQPRLPGNVVLSGLDLLDLALTVSAGEVGIVTYSKPHCEVLIRGHPALDRLRIVGLSDQPSWAYLSRADHGQLDGWSQDTLRKELVSVLQRERQAGMLRDVNALVLECTVLPQYRAAIRSVIDVPIFDARTLALALLYDPPATFEPTSGA